jgi:hypothetical protein
VPESSKAERVSGLSVERSPLTTARRSAPARVPRGDPGGAEEPISRSASGGSTASAIARRARSRSARRPRGTSDAGTSTPPSTRALTGTPRRFQRRAPLRAPGFERAGWSSRRSCASPAWPGSQLQSSGGPRSRAAPGCSPARRAGARQPTLLAAGASISDRRVGPGPSRGRAACRPCPIARAPSPTPTATPTGTPAATPARCAALTRTRGQRIAAAAAARAAAPAESHAGGSNASPSAMPSAKGASSQSAGTRSRSEPRRDRGIGER